MPSHETFEQAIVGVTREEASSAVRRAAADQMFKNPMTREAADRLLNVIFQELPAFDSAARTFAEVIQTDAGWTEEQAELLSKGFEMSLLVFDELIREERRGR